MENALMEYKTRLFNIFNIVMALVFLVFVAVQYNDPDPLRWIAMYSAAALVCVLSAMHKAHYLMMVLIGLISLVWAAMLAPDVIGKVSFGELFASMQMKSVAVELGRETGGLLIVFLWMAVLTVVLRRRPI